MEGRQVSFQVGQRATLLLSSEASSPPQLHSRLQGCGAVTETKPQVASVQGGPSRVCDTEGRSGPCSRRCPVAAAEAHPRVWLQA